MSAGEVSRVALPQGARIPTLAAALREFPRLCFNIDLKDGGSVTSVPRVLEEEDALRRVCLTSFSERRIAAARRLLGPEACTGLGVGGIVRVALTALLPGRARTGGAAIVQIPFTWHRIRLVRRCTVRWAHGAGLTVHAWTLNDRGAIRCALDANVDGIVSDDLRLLKEVLIARGQWRRS